MRELKYISSALCIALALFMLVEAKLKAQAKALLLFGDEDHKTFLGCLNCGTGNSKSVCNSVIKYGSSISHDSTYGTRLDRSGRVFLKKVRGIRLSAILRSSVILTGRPTSTSP